LRPPALNPAQRASSIRVLSSLSLARLEPEKPSTVGAPPTDPRIDASGVQFRLHRFAYLYADRHDGTAAVVNCTAHSALKERGCNSLKAFQLNTPDPEITLMKNKLILTSLLAVLTIPAMAQTATPAVPATPAVGSGTSATPATPAVPPQARGDGQLRRDQRDIRQDRRDVGRDERQLNQERRERNMDQRRKDAAIRRGDAAGAQKMEARREQEQREIRGEKREIARDRTDLRRDRRERNHDAARAERRRR